MKKKNFFRTTPFDVFLTIIMLFVIVITVYPLYTQVVISIASTKDAFSTGMTLIPTSLDFTGWKVMMSYASLWRGYWNTIVRTIAGVTITVIVTALYAYPLSKKYLPYRKFFIVVIFITMFFGGGLIPNFLLMKNLKLFNTLWVMVLPGAITGFNVFIMRNFFVSLPESIEESARIDGASQLRIFWQIVLPLSLPVVATVALWSGVGHWQEWFSNLLYINEPKKWVVMMVARKILVEQSYDTMTETVRNLGMKTALKGAPNERQIRACVIVCTVLPMLFVYPFVQKFFVKGINLGAVKG